MVGLAVGDEIAPVHKIVVPVSDVPELHGMSVPVVSPEVEPVEKQGHRFYLHVGGMLYVFSVGGIGLFF